MWHDHARRTTMLGRQRFVIVFYGNERLTVDDVCKGHIRGIAAVAIGSNEHGFAIEFNMFEQGVETYALPFHIEMSPLGDAGNINNINLHGKFEKILPSP